MHFDQYTDGVICSAMGIGPFEPLDDLRSIRLLLKPSFHPELCITLHQLRLSIVALRSKLWQEPVPHDLLQLAAAIPTIPQHFEDTLKSFQLAAAANAAKRPSVCVDGMPVSAIYKSTEGYLSFSGHPTSSDEICFVVNLLRLANDLAASVPLRNRISECGRYLDRSFIVEPESNLHDTTRIVVLGSPKDRTEYLAMLRAATSKSPT